MPRGFRAGDVVVQLVLLDGAIASPEMREELHARDIAVSKGVVGEGTDVNVGDGVDELLCKSLVDVVVEIEEVLFGLVLTGEICYLGCGGVCWDVGVGAGIDWRLEGDVALQLFELFCWHGENEVAVATIAFVGADGDGVAVELILEAVKGFVMGLFVGGKRSEDFDGEGGEDAC
jgi:hypothetical protein